MWWRSCLPAEYAPDVVRQRDGVERFGNDVERAQFLVLRDFRRLHPCSHENHGSVGACRQRPQRLQHAWTSFELLPGRLQRDGLDYAYAQIELPVVDPTVSMIANGLGIDRGVLEQIECSIGTRLDILSRQRYGNGDHGVNAARLGKWLSQL